MTVDELAKRMSSRELSEWIAFDALNAEERARKELATKARAGVEERHRKPKRRR